MTENKIMLPDKILAVIERLANGGYRGYAVGGCVRDMLMGKNPHDFDITTDAFPSETRECFSDCDVILTGLKHGTVTVVFDKENIEITTFRADGEYLDNRHPSEVIFVRNIAEDLSRRDFTVNAMAYNPEVGLVDMFDGVSDIERKIIRCVGVPDERFNEDGLRILRAMRFASVLGFEIEEKTAESLIRNRNLLRNISAERIYSEFTKLLLGDGAKKIINQFYPVVVSLFGEIPSENIEAVSRCPKHHAIRYAALFAHLDAFSAGEKMRFLKTDNETLRLVKKFVDNVSRPLPSVSSERFERDVMHLISQNGYADLEMIVKLKRAFGKESRETLDAALRAMDNSKKENACISINHLAIGGNDLAEIGVPKSPKMGEILGNLLYLVIEGEVENERFALLERAREM